MLETHLSKHPQRNYIAGLSKAKHRRMVASHPEKPWNKERGRLLRRREVHCTGAQRFEEARVAPHCKGNCLLPPGNNPYPAEIMSFSGKRAYVNNISFLGHQNPRAHGNNNLKLP